MKKTVCVISLSNIAADSRVLRQIEYLSKEYSVIVIGYGTPPKQYFRKCDIVWKEIPLSRLSVVQSVLKLITRLIQVPLLPKTNPAYKMALESNCDAYHANNWDSLPMASLAAKENGAKLVLDLHESFDSWYWGLSSGLVKSVLRKYSPAVDRSTTVVGNLVEQHREFGLTPMVIRNIPAIPLETITPKKTSQENIHLVHHGVASPTRSSDLMIRVIALCDSRYDLHLTFTNLNSRYVNKLRRLAEEISPGRVTFHPAYPAMEIVHNIAEYDIGFFPIPPKNYNYLITLPNKLFEFIAAGLAVLIGPSPSMAEIVNEYHCGVVASSFEPDVLAAVLNQTTAEQWDQMKRASITASKHLNADMEMAKLLDIYKELFLNG
jgi:glycosyltransferase involved in cell wall biosynthesis